MRFSFGLVFVSAIMTFTVPSRLVADDRGKLLFKDDFERNESQETTDEVGNGWGTNSKARAAGNKQVDLRDGAMYITMHKAADHAVSVTHPAEFQNGSVELRFMLEHADDSLGLNIADLKFKEVWAGHLFVAKVSTKQVELTDLKTGNMDLKTREQRQAGTLSDEMNAKLKAKTKRVPHKLETGKWYALQVTVQGDTVSVSIDGEKIASFSSEGIAHPTKRTLRLAVPRNAVVDDVMVFAK
jgi:hypothetical protein